MFKDCSSEYVFHKAGRKVKKKILSTQPCYFPHARSQNPSETKGQCSKFLYVLFQTDFFPIDSFERDGWALLRNSQFFLTALGQQATIHS